LGLELAVIVLALSAGSIVKGAIGMGLPMIALPIMAAFLGVPHAIAIMSLPILFSNASQAWVYRHKIKDQTYLPWMLATSIVGMLLGTWLLTELPEHALSLFLGALVFVYVGLRLTNPALTMSMPTAKRISPAVGLGAGLLQGATGVSSPVTVTFAHSLRLPRPDYVAGMSCIFLVPTIVQFPTLWFADVLTWHRLLESALALVPVAVLMPVGAWLSRFISRRMFDWIILGVLTAIAVELVVKGAGA
jgi:uncharacterized membrane protein YfcA